MHFPKTFVILSPFTKEALGARKYDRRSDLENVQAISATGWTVPLSSGASTTALAIPGNNDLVALAVGRGSVTYNCSDDSANTQPTRVTQQADLYDIAPLVQFLQNVNNLNVFTQAFVSYDYTSLQNSTLTCIGHMTSNGLSQCYDFVSVIDGKFELPIVQTIVAQPINQNFNWTLAIRDGYEVYMVETVGGEGPASCAGQVEEISVPFAAEFWFYH